VRTFQIGFAPDNWSYLLDRLKQDSVPLNIAAEAGLLIRKEDGGFYDRFRKRLMFPIVDMSGRVIAFGGRIIGDGEPKYLNSPESPVYVKGRHLYGLHFAKESIREKGYAILVEGYFDLIVLWNAGIKNVVATLGTAMTGEQVRLLKRYTDSVMAVFDPDEAGKKALARSLPLYLAGNMDAKAVILPDGLDPADFVCRHGAQHFESVLDQAPIIEDFFINQCLGGGESLKSKQDDEMAAIALSLQIENPAVRNLFLKKVAEFLGVDLAILKEEYLRKAKPVSSEVAPQVTDFDLGSINKIEMALIQLMINDPERIPAISRSGILDCFETDELRDIGNELQAMYKKRGKVDTESLMVRLESNPLMGQLAGHLINEEQYEDGMADRLQKDMISQIRRQWTHRCRKELKGKLTQAEKEGDLELCNLLLQEIEKLGQKQKAIR
jgi:DNA primase